MPTASNNPAALFGLLGLQNFGEMPREVLYNLSPVVDLLQLYKNSAKIHGFCTFTPALGIVTPTNPGLAGSTYPEVPAGQWWWVEHVSLRLNPAAGISYRGQIGLQERPAQFTALSDITPAAVANPMHVFLRGQNGFWMSPGSLLVANYDTITGAPGADSSLMTFRYCPFRG